jgi:hypothetical protein
MNSFVLKILRRIQDSKQDVTGMFTFSTEEPRNYVGLIELISNPSLLHEQESFSGRVVECLKMEERDVKNMTG